MGFPGKFESSNVSRDNVSSEIERTGCLFIIITTITILLICLLLLIIIIITITHVGKRR